MRHSDHSNAVMLDGSARSYSVGQLKQDYAGDAYVTANFTAMSI